MSTYTVAFQTASHPIIAYFHSLIEMNFFSFFICSRLVTKIFRYYISFVRELKYKEICVRIYV